MKTELYHCDKCKEKVDSENDLRTVAISAHRANINYSQYQAEFKMELCIKCREKLGLIKIYEEEDKLTKKNETDKDKLYDIIANMVADEMANQG